MPIAASLPLLPTRCTILFVLHEALSCDCAQLKALARFRTGAPRLKDPAMPNPEQDRASAIADLHEIPNADRDALVCSIVSRWPDATSDEIERAIELATAVRADLIEDYWTEP
jgi:hypothetical protein